MLFVCVHHGGNTKGEKVKGENSKDHHHGKLESLLQKPESRSPVFTWLTEMSSRADMVVLALQVNQFSHILLDCGEDSVVIESDVPNRKKPCRRSRWGAPAWLSRPPRTPCSSPRRCDSNFELNL